MPAAIGVVGAIAANAYPAYAGWIALAAAAASYAVADRQKRKASRKARDAYNDSLEDRLQMVSSAAGARSRVYGEVRNVDGVVFKGTHGTHSQFYTLVVALAGHECESIEKVYFNDQELELESDGAGGFWVMTEPFRRQGVFSSSEDMTNGGGGASVTLPHTPIPSSLHGVVTNLPPDSSYPTYASGDFTIVGNTVSLPTVDPAHVVTLSYQYSEAVPKARVWKYLGTDAQDIGSDLLASRFPTLINTGANDDRFAGMCALVAELEFDQDAFPLGLPNITALVKGAKIYDPRTGLTAWSQNPALIARDWSLYEYGGGCSTDEVSEAAIIAAANACDIETDFTTTDGTETRPLYQCDIVCKLDAPPDQGWLAEIVESMAGKWGWAGGVLRMVAGVYRTPAAHITEDWVSDAEDIGLVKDIPIADVVNVYRPTIANADAPVEAGTGNTAAYAMAAMPEVRSEAYITADGRELPREVTLGGVIHNVHARHICGVMMRDARYGMTLQLPCKMHAWGLELFDVVTVTLPIFGFVAAEFEVIGWQFSTEKGVILTLKQIDASIFDPDELFLLPNSELNTSLVLPWVVEDIENFDVVDAPEDGTQQSRALVSWDAITGESVRQSGSVEVQYREVTSTYSEADWKSWLEAGTATSTLVPGLRSGAPYMFRARAVNTLGVRGAWCTQLLYAPSVPLIETDQLAPGSVTEVVQGTLDTTVHGGGWTGDLPGQTTVTPAVDCRLIITAVGIISASNSTGGTRVTRAAVYIKEATDAFGLIDGGGGLIRRNIVDGETWEENISLTVSVDGEAGETYEIGMGYSDHIAATIGTELTSVQIRIEVIKR
jgi:hypothetical protein